MEEGSSLYGMGNKLIGIAELTAWLGLSKSTIYKMIRDDEFPAPIKIGSRRVAWKVSVVEQWIDKREGES